MSQRDANLLWLRDMLEQLSACQKQLEWAEDHEEQARNNVDERKVPVAGEDVIEPGERRGYRIGGRWRGTITVRNDRSKVHDSAGCDSDSDEGQENDGNP